MTRARGRAEDGRTHPGLPSSTLLAALVLGAASLPATQLSVGAVREEITPPSGYRDWSTKDGNFEGVISPLYARAVVVSDGVRRLVFLQWDLVNTRADGVAEVRGMIAGAIGVPPDHILVNASHDHSAPLAPFADRGLLAMNEDDAIPAPDPGMHRRWVEKLYGASVAAARAANASLAPAALEVSRAAAPEWQFNRRPRRPDGAVTTIFEPKDPYTLAEGMRFGPTDPTVTVLAFRDSRTRRPVTLFSYPCHAVSVYPYSRAFCADWPGFAEDAVEAAAGGRAVFLQGCAGDLVPSRRGIAAAREMGALIGGRVAAAEVGGLLVDVDRLEAASAWARLPWNAAQRAKTGADHGEAEVQVFGLGSVAIAALPGEPMIEIAMAIQKRSPFPHTLVLGYSNGGGAIYVGMPGELARGGYETTADSAHGTDECGTILIDTALSLLNALPGARGAR